MADDKSNNKLLRFVIIGGGGVYLLYYTKTGEHIRNIFNKLFDMTEKIADL